jgi:DNA repair protein RecN (Recombination protein N)
MLATLTIHDVVLIEKLVLSLAPGLNVFTGETGAGKSIVLDALGLALGARSDAALVRVGAAQASVAAEFTLPNTHEIFSFAAAQGIVHENPLILRRIILADGKTRAFVNDQPVSVGLLKQFGERLLEIHGQFETHGLLNPASHRGLLDAFAGNAALKTQTAKHFTTWQDAVQNLQTAVTDRARAAAEEEFLRAAVHELNELSPEPHEADTLSTKRTSLQHREKILDALNTAQTALDGDKGAGTVLAQAGKAVARVVDKAEALKDILATIDRAANEAAEATQQLSKFLNDIDAQPDALQRIEERLFALRAIARKHGVEPSLLSDVQRDLTARLSLLTDQGDAATSLAKQAAEAKNTYIKSAQTLSTKRHDAATRLTKAVMKELPPLKLERAQFIIDIIPLPDDQFSADGMDRVAFLIAANPGSAPGALHKVASGGELARVILALKVVLAAADLVPVLVFDEVDSGIGGATASAVGERLAQLAKHVQILTVTHSPQVAARGAHHLQVSKSIKGKTTTTQVIELDPIQRCEEIARMLAGAEVTDAARQAAESLLTDAEPAPIKIRRVK